MHEYVLKAFGFLKSSIQFSKIIIVFLIMMLILYWIQNLTGDFWTWSAFLNPLFDALLKIGSSIAPGSFDLFDAVFEYKFAVATGIFLVTYFMMNLFYIIVEKIEEAYCNIRIAAHKMEEKRINKAMEDSTTNEQRKLKKYQIYISTHTKGKMAHRQFNVDLEGQTKQMLKFLIEKTCCTPKKYGEGFLFTFEYFNDIDKVLDSFVKLFASKVPIDYVICVQIFGSDIERETKQLAVLKDLKMLNKIVMMADTAYRYNFNIDHGYEISQLGEFQKEGATFEVHEFVKKKNE